MAGWSQYDSKALAAFPPCLPKEVDILEGVDIIFSKYFSKGRAAFRRFTVTSECNTSLSLVTADSTETLEWTPNFDNYWLY
jgi:hypothetical protein